MVPLLDPVIFPLQFKSPVAFTTKHPVALTPPASSTLPVEVFPICTSPVPPASRVRLEVPPAAIAPLPAKVRESASTDMVSIEVTPVNAPRVVTLRPPFEARENVPVAFPTDTFPVPVPSDTFPLPFTVKVPVPDCAKLPEVCE